jgi:hypothetical protein
MASAIGNQGRFIQADEPLRWNGLAFATQSELRFAEALERAGLFFAPAIGCRVSDEGGSRRTREADFLIVHRGVPVVVELDGRPHDGRAADDYARDRAFKRAGIWLIERFRSVEALKDPDRLVRMIRSMARSYRRSA